MGAGRLSLAPYQALVALAEEERALALDGRWDDLQGVLDRRAAVIASLPAADPVDARPLLERALAAHAQAHGALSAARAAVLAELGDTCHARAAAAGYRAAAGAQAATRAADYRG
jgi:hypothetical protein